MRQGIGSKSLSFGTASIDALVRGKERVEAFTAKGAGQNYAEFIRLRVNAGGDTAAFYRRSA
jgi:hypothetical protein